jgi:hypothetical protein
MTHRLQGNSDSRPPAHSQVSRGDGLWSSRPDIQDDAAPLDSQRRGAFVDEDRHGDDRFQRQPMAPFDPESNRLTEYLVACFDAANASLTQVLQDTPYIYGAGALAFTVALIPFVGVAPASAAALVVIASTVTSAMLTVLPDYMRQHGNSSGATKLAAVVLNTAAVTLAVAAVLGVTIPGAKGIIACATITAGVKYAQLTYFQNPNRSEREYRAGERD